MDNNEELYLKIEHVEDYYINIYWSSNPSEDSNTVGTLGISVYDSNGEELDGAAKNISRDQYVMKGEDLHNYIDDCLSLVSLEYDYTEMSEDDFNSIVY